MAAHSDPDIMRNFAPSIELDVRWPDWRTLPFADFPQYVVLKVLHIDTELDALWPGWREKVPFHKCGYDLLARLKWLMKRRALLLTREGGAPAPRDWDVLIARDGKNPNKCYAHPVLPVNSTEATTREPPSPLQSTESR